MNFYFTPEQQAWKNEVEQFLKTEVTEQLLAEMHAHEDREAGPLEISFEQKIIERNWNKIDIPMELGGLEMTEMEKYIFNRAINRFQAPYYVGSITSMVINAINRFGTEHNKERFLPSILNGEMTFALGYSEPNAGTDLANLRTTATREGDEWVINGTKTWNTVGHRVTHQWLLARTGNVNGRHKTLSMFLVPMNIQGVSITPIHTWGDHTVNEIYFENVRIPVDHLIGVENDGWRIVNFALDLERITIGDASIIERIVEEAIEFAQQPTILGESPIDNPVIATKLVEAEIATEICSLLCYEAISKLDDGQDVSVDAAVVKVYGSELRANVAALSMEILGPLGQLHGNDKDAPFQGFTEHQYRFAPFYRFGGGTNEVQRNIIAQRGLQLSRR